jgi:SAM-dependent methyltransferase
MTSQNPRRDARFHLHRSHFLEYVELSKERGLEIGAFDLPLVEPSEGRCDLADWNSIEYLRDLAERRPGHNPDYVAPVQFKLRQGFDQIPEGYDWISASHVIEHVPDIIGWLTQVHSKLRPGGILFLVIPDKGYTFDIPRRESTFTEALVAHRSALKHPSFAQVFDYFYYSAPGVIAHDVWAGNPVSGPKLDPLGRGNRRIVSWRGRIAHGPAMGNTYRTHPSPLPYRLRQDDRLRGWLWPLYTQAA